VYADAPNTCLTYTPAHAWCSKHRSKCMHTLRRKCTCTRACASMQRCRNFFAMETIANHCFWQASDSVCTTVLTVTMSRKKTRFARFFHCDVHSKLQNDLETTNKQTNVIDSTMRTLVMHTNKHTHTHTHTHTHVVRVCVPVCVYMCVCVRGRVCEGRCVCVWVCGCM